MRSLLSYLHESENTSLLLVANWSFSHFSTESIDGLEEMVVIYELATVLNWNSFKSIFRDNVLRICEGPQIIWINLVSYNWVEKNVLGSILNILNELRVSNKISNQSFTFQFFLKRSQNWFFHWFQCFEPAKSNFASEIISTLFRISLGNLISWSCKEAHIAWGNSPCFERLVPRNLSVVTVGLHRSAKFNFKSIFDSSFNRSQYLMAVLRMLCRGRVFFKLIDSRQAPSENLSFE